jgi:hypothetical protein
VTTPPRSGERYDPDMPSRALATRSRWFVIAAFSVVALFSCGGGGADLRGASDLLGAVEHDAACPQQRDVQGPQWSLPSGKSSGGQGRILFVDSTHVYWYEDGRRDGYDPAPSPFTQARWSRTTGSTEDVQVVPPEDAVVDATTIYWWALVGPGGLTAFRRADATAVVVSPPVGELARTIVSFTGDATTLYGTTEEATIVGIPKTGGDWTVRVDRARQPSFVAGSSMLDLAVDDSRFYWFEQQPPFANAPAGRLVGNGSPVKIVSASKAGGDPVELATILPHLYGQNATSFVWVTEDRDNTKSLWALSKTGGDPQRIRTGLLLTDLSFEVGSTALYAVNDGLIRIPLDPGEAVSSLGTAQYDHTMKSFFTDGPWVFWVATEGDTFTIKGHCD